MKKLNKKKVLVVFILLLIVIVGLIIIFKFTFNNKKDNNEPKIQNEIKEYGYILLIEKQELYKTYFEELKEILESEIIDEKQYASTIVKLFIADFYDLKNKTTKNDVGGLQFIYENVQENFLLNAKDTIYKYIENNVEGKRKQTLPSVKDVTISDVQMTSYTHDQTNTIDNKSYKVNATWEYNEELGYQNKATFTLMHVDKKLVIVEIK